MICALFYFLYFAAFGVYTPYWTLYLNDLRLTPMQIGVICSVPSAARILLPPIYGYMADRWKARRGILIFCSFAQLIPLALIAKHTSYQAIFLLIAAFALFNSCLLSFTEATAQEEQEKGRLDYGRTRLWGTLSFILLAVGFGFFLDAADSHWVLYGFFLFFFLTAVVSIAMPEGKMRMKLGHAPVKKIFAKPNTWIFLACVFLMHMSHGTFYGFFSIYLSELGFKDSGIGLQWAVSATSELLIFYFASRILRQFESRKLLTLCCIAASLRWFLTGSCTSFWLLTLIQCLHAFTFGVFHITSMRLVHRFFPEGSRAIGQALYTSVSGGLGSVLGILINGRLWAPWGGKTFFLSGAIMLLAAVISLRLKEPEPALHAGSSSLNQSVAQLDQG